MIENLFQDLRYTVRTFRSNPLFVLTALLSLAIGIGANTAIFTVVNTVLLHPLPYPDSDRIVTITRKGGGNNSVPMFSYWERNNPGFEDLSAFQTGASASRAAINLSGGDQPELVQPIRASRNYFRLFGARPILGRTFTAQEDSPGGAPVVVMSYGLWLRSFAGDHSIIGRTVNLGGAPYTCIGVLAPGLNSYPAGDVWIPLQADPASTNQAHTNTVSARLPKGISLSQANAWMAVVGKQYVETHPEQLGGDDTLDVEFLQQTMTGGVRPGLSILIGAVASVLLIACVNVANLLLARATTRQREIAIRTSIGGGRSRIVWQLLTESLSLALIGGACGLVLGSVGLRALLRLAPVGFPRIQELINAPALDPRVAGFTFALSVLTGILFGLFPAMQLSRMELSALLQESSGRTGTSRKHNRTRSLLVATEVALAVVLLCGAVLLIRTFVELRKVNLGIDPKNVLTIEISLAGPGYAKSSEVGRFARQLTATVTQIPGVESAALSSGVPLEGGMDMIFDIPGRQQPEGRKFAGDVQFRVVSERYFDTLRIPLKTGRLFSDHERAGTLLINQAMANQFWPNADALGQRIVVGPTLDQFFDGSASEIVGVVGDVRELLDEEPPPTMYLMPSQLSDNAIALLNEIQAGAVIIRTREGVAPRSVEQQVRQSLRTNTLPAGKIRTMDQVSLNSTARRNFDLTLLSIFASIAVVLAAVGIYGVMSYNVEQRTLEIGVRAAMGATPPRLLRFILRQALRMTVLGLTVGLAGAAALTPILKSQLFGVGPFDPVTFVAVALIVTAVALVAGYLPGVRASRIDPIVALRHK